MAPDHYYRHDIWRRKDGTGLFIKTTADAKFSETWYLVYERIHLFHSPPKGLVVLTDDQWVWVESQSAYQEDPTGEPLLPLTLEGYKHWKLIYDNPDL